LHRDDALTIETDIAPVSQRAREIWQNDSIQQTPSMPSERGTAWNSVTNVPPILSQYRSIIGLSSLLIGHL
jgi:hypothetical protein